MSVEQNDPEVLQDVDGGWSSIDGVIKYEDDGTSDGGMVEYVEDDVDYKEQDASNAEYLETNESQRGFSFDATADNSYVPWVVCDGNNDDEDDVKTEERCEEAVPEQHLSHIDDDANRYYCCECNSLFGDFESAEQHDCPALNAVEAHESASSDGATISVDDETEIYVCFCCELTFETNEGLEMHRLTCRKKEISAKGKQTNAVAYYHCGNCDLSYNSEHALRTHARTHKSQNKSSNLMAVNAEQLQVHVPLPAICSICNTTFRSQKNLKLHMKIHDKRPTKSIQEALPDCAKVQYNELNQFFCEICNKSFEQNLLAVHQQMHTQAEEYVCGICNRQFENLPSYEVHQQMHIDVGRNPPQSSKRPRQQTQRNAGKKLTFPCQYCGHEFPRPHEKVKHERVHTGEKPYPCEVCGKTFRVSYSLTLHLRTHTDIRPYVCATCNKRFKSQPVYVHHMKTHLAERMYTCDICKKSFRTSVQLNGHRKSHSKPYNCPDCNRPFAAMYALKLHMKTHSKTHKSSQFLRHRCTICGAVYARNFALQLHVQDQHGIDETVSQEAKRDVPEVGHGSAKTEVVADDNEDDEFLTEDNEAAVLIAAAAGANYTDAEAANQMANEGILQNDEAIADNYGTEEIVEDWLSNYGSLSEDNNDEHQD